MGRVQTGDLYGLVRTVSRMTQPGMPDRLRFGLKLPSEVISDWTEAYLAKWSKSFDLSVPTRP